MSTHRLNFRPATPPTVTERLPDNLVSGVCRSLGLSSGEHVTAGVRRAMARAAAQNAADYRRLLDTDQSAVAALITELTVGETYFLREIGQLDFMRHEVLPKLAARADSRPITAWSAGCASGEEAYTIAMMAEEATPPCRISVLGTDIAESRLAIARKAVYGEWSLRGVPQTIVERHFQRANRSVKVSPRIRSMVDFRAHNLAADDWSVSGIAPRSMDLIFCRNVLIYLDAATIERVATRLLASLSDHGWLFLGASDSALAELAPCEVVVTGSGLAYRRVRKDASRTGRASHDASGLFPAPAPRITEREGIAQLRQSPPATEQARPAAEQNVQRHGKSDDSAGTTRALLVRARDEYLRGDYPRSAALSRDCVTESESDAEAWIILVRSLANLGLNEEAGLACASGLDLHRTSAELTYLHAVLLRQSSRNVEALAALRCALYLDRGFVVAHLAVGDVLSALGDRGAARQAFRNAERLLVASVESQPIPGSDGLTAGRLLAVARARLSLLDQPLYR